MKTQKEITFNDWLDQQGPLALARKLKINLATIKQWQKGAAYPRVEQMKVIRRISKGIITYEKIIDRSKTKIKG